MYRILLLDRYYSIKYARSDKYEFILVALTKSNKTKLQNEGFNVVGCFEEEFDSLESANYEGNYLTYSYDSDRFLNRYSFDERRVILGKEITFWRNILDKYSPNIIVNEACTIEWMEVLYIEACKRNIEYKPFLFGQMSGKTYWMETPYNSALSMERLDSIHVSQEHIRQAEEFCNAIKNKPNKPFYTIQKQHSKFKCLVSSIKSYVLESLRVMRQKGFVYEQYIDMKKNSVERSWKILFGGYDELNYKKDIEYVFYPLHYEPEATLSYFSEFYSDQVKTIKMISHCLKANQILIVKEHPQQLGMLLTRRFKEIKHTCKNVIYLSGDVLSFDIFKNIKLLITLTGTGGYEAMIQGIPVIVLGDVFYNHCSSVNYCTSERDLKKMIRDNSYVYPNKQATVNFVAKFMSLQNSFFPFIINGKYKEEDVNGIRTYLESFV